MPFHLSLSGESIDDLVIIHRTRTEDDRRPGGLVERVHVSLRLETEPAVFLVGTIRTLRLSLLLRKKKKSASVIPMFTLREPSKKLPE